MVPLDPHGGVGRGRQPALEVSQLVLHQTQVRGLSHELGRLALVGDTFGPSLVEKSGG